MKVFSKINPTVNKIRCDNGEEYLANDLVNFSRDLCIVIDHAPPYTLVLNGVAERFNRSLLDIEWVLIAKSKKFWE